MQFGSQAISFSLGPTMDFDESEFLISDGDSHEFENRPAANCGKKLHWMQILFGLCNSPRWILFCKIGFTNKMPTRAFNDI